MNHADDWIARSRRVPLYVPVATEPRFDTCWAVNLSESGIGLTATRLSATPPPPEGSGITLSFSLAGGEAVRARGVIRWLYDTSGGMDGRGVIALGVEFTDVEDTYRSRLRSYFSSYLPSVAVLWASGEERHSIEHRLGDGVNLLFADDEDELGGVLGRGDIATVLICGADSERAFASLERINAGPERLQGSTTGLTDDLAPRVIFAARAKPRRLVDAFNRGRLFAALDLPLDERKLETEVLRATRDHGLRVGQYRVAFALERSLARERARVRTVDVLEDVERSQHVGRSHAINEVTRLVRIVAPHPVGVLLLGETGVGKEVVGKLVHALSDRAHAPFVVQDCGALTETLLDSELFGHVKGAFTGAAGSHPGLFVTANGGTIFLDEIQNASQSVQAKLLRAIETGEIRPVGSSESRQVDVRVIAASNQDLEEAVRAGRLRADLYFRLAAFVVPIPPLRERREDISALALHFLERANRALGRSAPGLSEAAADALLRYRWPGNVRELKNVIERAVLLSVPGRPIGVELLPPGLLTPGPVKSGDTVGSLRQRLEDAEREMIRAALERNEGVIRRAAAELEMNPVTLGRRARRYGLA